MLLGGLLFLITVVRALIALVLLVFPFGLAFWMIYYALWAFVSLLIFIQVPSWQSLASAGSYTGLQQKILLWAILGLIFGVILGLLLIVIYIRLGPPGGGLYFSQQGQGSGPSPGNSSAASPLGSQPPQPPSGDPSNQIH